MHISFSKRRKFDFSFEGNVNKIHKTIKLYREPNFEAIGGKLDLCFNSAFGVKYENFVNISKAISNYLDKVLFLLFKRNF